MTLDVAISTISPEGISRVAAMQLPRIANVRYVISWQDHRDMAVPEEISQRDDIDVFRTDTRGLSLNRNNSFLHCTADIILIGDDDLIYNAEGLQSVIRCFEEHPEVDVATFRSQHDNLSGYPTESTKLGHRLPKGYCIISFETAFRRSTGLRCCPELGLGSTRLHAGEDEMMVLSAIHRGLHCQYFPVTICEHPGVSTGYKMRPTAANIRAAGCVIALTYGFSTLLRIPLKAWRLWRYNNAPLLSALWHLSSGAIAAHGVLKRNHDTLW